MEITTVSSFVSYYQRTRKITNDVLKVIPPNKMDWAYAPGKFTLADQVRHIAAIERNLFMEVIQGNKPAYTGCGTNLANGYENVMHYFHEMHRQSMDILQALADEDLQKQIKTLDGRIITIAGFLRALVVHEIHHRAAIIIYLNILGITTPPVMGLTEKQVIEFSK